MIALMGAAGNVGSKVADLLLARGEEMRALEHGRSLRSLEERGAPTSSTATRARSTTLRELFAGADAAFVLLPDDLADPRFVATRSAMSEAIAAALAGAADPATSSRSARRAPTGRT